MSDLEIVKQLEVLFPKGTPITLGGEEFVIKPFTLNQMLKVFNILGDLKTPVLQSMQTKEKINEASVMKLYAAGATQFTEVAAEVIKKSPQWVGDLPANEGLILITTILLVNSDFFVSEIAPMLGMDLMKNSNQQIG